MAGSRFYALDIVRALACLWVFAVHLPELDRLVSLHPWIAPIVDEPSRAFATFFVLSGYAVMASLASAERRGERAVSWLLRRLWRIFPLYWLAIILAVLVPYLVELISAVKSGAIDWPTPKYLEYSPSDWVHIVLGTQVLRSGERLPVEGYSALNSPFWAVGVIVQFYVLAAGTLLAPRRGRVPILVSALALGIGASSLLESPRGLVIHHLHYYACGVALFLCLAHGIAPRRVLGARASWIAAAALVALVCAYVLADASATLHEAAPTFTWSLFLTLGLWLVHAVDASLDAIRRGGSWTARLLIEPLFALGAMSYTVFLFHGRLYWIPAMGARKLAADGTLTFSVLVMVTTTLACVPIHRGLERPLARVLERAKRGSGGDDPEPRAGAVRDARDGNGHESRERDA